MFTVRKILVFCQASLFPASFVSKEHGVWSPEGLSWNSGCPSAPSPWGQLSKGQESLPYRTAMRVHEKRCKRHDAADGSQQKQQACPLSLIDSDPTCPPAQWPAWTSQEEAPGPTSFTPRFCPLQQRQDPFLGVGTSGREVSNTLPHPAANTVHSCYCLISSGPRPGSIISISPI